MKSLLRKATQLLQVLVDVESKGDLLGNEAEFMKGSHNKSPG